LYICQEPKLITKAWNDTAVIKTLTIIHKPLTYMITCKSR